jgi:predicted secreted protein
MAGTAIPGRLAKLEVSDDGGSTFENVGGGVDIGININVDELECTTHDSNGTREYIPNHDDATIDISGRWLDGDNGQEIILVALTAKTRFDFIYYMEKDPGSGKRKFEGQAFATSYNPNGPLDDTGNLDITLRVSGLVIGVQ